MLQKSIKYHSDCLCGSTALMIYHIHFIIFPVKGSEECPWVIESRPGQRINITLYDFARHNEGDPENHDVCRLYATITEADTDKVSELFNMALPNGKFTCTLYD